MKIGLQIVLLLFITSAIYSQIEVKEREIEPGVIHKRIINQKDTLVINILKADIKNHNYDILNVKAGNGLKGREKTSTMVEGCSDSLHVIAAINADFFEGDGELINNFITEGKYIKATRFTDRKRQWVHSQFAFTKDDKPYIEQFVFSAELELPDKSMEKISRINSTTDSNSITLYNSFQGEYTPEVSEKWRMTEIELIPLSNSNDTLICIAGKKYKKDENQITKERFILSASCAASEFINREIQTGDTIRIVLEFNPDIDNIEVLTGGWGQIVNDGMNITTLTDSVEGTAGGFTKTRHPRTGIGYDKQGSTIYFITVDGRQKVSRGISLNEFADIMLSEGIYDGLNLDGGGSTTMVVENEIVNNPSDLTGERKVGNCLMLIKAK